MIIYPYTHSRDIFSISLVTSIKTSLSICVICVKKTLGDPSDSLYPTIFLSIFVYFVVKFIQPCHTIPYTALFLNHHHPAPYQRQNYSTDHKETAHTHHNG